MFPDLFHRKARRSLLIELNPYRVLVAAISRTDSGQTMVHSAADFDRGDDAGLDKWIGDNFRGQKMWIPTVCGLVPRQGLIQRESMPVRKLAAADYLPNFVREKYKIEDAPEWRFQVLSPIEGKPLVAAGLIEPVLICGIANREVARVEQMLFARQLRPERVDLSVLSLFGIVFDQLARRDEKSAAVVVCIGEDETLAYILGKEGVYTPAPIRFGLNSIVDAARKELNLPDGADVMPFLAAPGDERSYFAPRLIRAIGRSLKPVIDSYELTIGQPAGGIYCAYLPEELTWVGEALAEAVERPAFTIDCNELLATAGLQRAPEVPPFAAHWLGALSLVAELPDRTQPKDGRGDERNVTPWHVDCQSSSDLPSRQLVGRSFITGAVGLALAAFMVTITVWQVAVTNSLRADTAYWETEMEKNRKLFDELTRAASELQNRSTRLDAAYDLMASPYQVSEFVMNLGRTLPRNTRIDRIELSQGKIAFSGALREPSETASGTINRYLDELRKNAAIGPLFSSIGLTAFQREEDSDAMAFEITFKLRPPPPPPAAPATPPS